ncbi:hypothetical protein ACFYXJ_30640 [Streptomyces sp. NPDC002667]|uniref:hypothetical protein n=1 Tax=Streptomyces sp. NPDC002667 TaxID=3364657 RepID=UPI0036A13DAE
MIRSRLARGPGGTHLIDGTGRADSTGRTDGADRTDTTGLAEGTGRTSTTGCVEGTSRTNTTGRVDGTADRAARTDGTGRTAGTAPTDGAGRTSGTGRSPGTGHTALPSTSAPVARARAVTRATALTALLLTALAGCGDSGELHAAGATPAAVGPTRLWPQLPPASTPAVDYGEADTETVKGVTAPGDDIRALDPVAVVRAEVAAHPDEYSGPHAAYAETARQLKDCGRPGARGRTCPVLRAYYRDLTGDGKADMVLGIRFPAHQLAVRVYTFLDHRLVQVMGTADSVVSVELAGRDVIIRSPSTLPGYEFRTVWSWDPHQNAMLATRDEILRVGPPTRAGSPTPGRSPSAHRASPSPASPTGSPSAVPPAADTVFPPSAGAS